MPLRFAHDGCPLAAAAVALLIAVPGCAADPFPTIPPDHKHARALLTNAMKYTDPAHKLTDPATGYPFEGWNHDTGKGVYLRSFTQLTAIGMWLELLSAVAAGHADTPHLTRDQALDHLTKITTTLRKDQRDPRIAAKGLLVNFLDLTGGKRTGPLATEVEKEQFEEALGKDKGLAVWKALIAKNWLDPWSNGLEAGIRRGEKYGFNHFDGELAPFNDDKTKKAVMDILDRRVVAAVFGDNANLSSSAAKAVGTLLLPGIKDDPRAAAVRVDLEAFLEDQRPGYTHLYDKKAGLFYFGWDATRDRMFGWEEADGIWKTGHSDYLVNEFRGPSAFIVLRYGLPVDALGNLGFKVKSYRMQDEKEVSVLAPWEGSAFQSLGLWVWPGELSSPSWRSFLEAVIDVQIDYTTRHKLPGFLSECYTDNGTQYTGVVGIPEIAVNPKPRITDAASLYALGAAYRVSPDKVEKYLAANWSRIESLFTDHGPWEGYNVTRKETILYQTTGHTLALALGLLGAGADSMKRYLETHGLSDKLADLTKPGDPTDLLAEGVPVYAWAQKDSDLRSELGKGVFQAKGDRIDRVGIAFVPPAENGVSLSGGVLTLRYKFEGPSAPATIALKPAGGTPPGSGWIAKEIFTRLADTGGREAELRIPLPATPGLARVKEVVLTYERGARGPIDLTISQLRFAPTEAEYRGK